MKYVSTRGGVRGASFQQALFSGYAPDGGLYFPERIPKVPTETLRQWSALTYPQLVRQLLSLFISEAEIPQPDIEGIVDRAFSQFDTEAVVELARLKDDLNVLELWHGPTLAFKDLALSCVGQLLEYFLNKRQEHVTILVGTSGDTGSSAIASVRGCQWADIVVLLPKGRCTQTQELQMTTVIEDNVHVFRVDGTSDDLDVPIKSVFLDQDFVKANHLLSINSINWARILVQIAHYFFAYFQMCPELDEKLEIVVPTGACGNITSGLIARQMGLHIRFVTAVNVNDIVARTVSTGDFSLASDVSPTLAPAMDIQMPYNMERLFYILSDGDTHQVAALMADMEVKGHICVPKAIHEKMRECVSSWRVDDAGIRQAMVACWTSNHYMVCPHTAVGVNYHHATTRSLKKTVCLATASPAKFEEAVSSAGLPALHTPAVAALYAMPTRYRDMKKGEDWEAALREVIQEITSNKRKSTLRTDTHQ